MAQAQVGTGSVMSAQALVGTGTGWHRLDLVRKGSVLVLLKSSYISHGGFATEANMAMA